MLMSMKNAGFIACGFVLIGASFFLLYKLGQEPLQDYDEATYAEVVHEAMTNHHYLSYTEGGAEYFEKPPLGFWAMEASVSALGENSFAMRLPFVLFGIAVVAVLMLVVYELSENPWAAALSGAILATTSPFMETARQVRLDVPVVFFIMLAAYFFMRGLQNPRWLIAFGAAVGLAVMTKSVIAVFALVFAACALVAYRRFDLVKNSNAYYAVAACLLVAAPWHLWEWAHFGNAFWIRYIGFDVIHRTQQNLFWTVTLTNADYLNYLEQFTQPWLGLFFAALLGTLLCWKGAVLQHRRFIAACAITIAIILAVFFSAKTKAPTYLLPIYPFAAAAMAIAAASIRPRLWQIAAAVVCALLVCSAASATYYNAYHLNPYFSVVISMAKDEEVIGKTLLAVPQTVPVYVFDDQNLGSIEYTSRHLLVLLLTATSTVPASGYIIVDTDGLPLFASTFPAAQVDMVYQGPQVSLLKLNH